MEGTSGNTKSTDEDIDPEALKEIAKFELFAIDFKLRQQGREHSGLEKLIKVQTSAHYMIYKLTTL